MRSLKDHNTDDEEIIELLSKHFEQQAQGRRRWGNMMNLMEAANQDRQRTSFFLYVKDSNAHEIFRQHPIPSSFNIH